MQLSGQGRPAFPAPPRWITDAPQLPWWRYQMVTQERLKELLNYNPDTGVFEWKIDIRAGRNKAFLIVAAGARAGFYGTYGYRYFVADGERHAEHRWAFLYMTGKLPPKHIDVDHVNMVRDDNRWANIRLATRSQNMQNITSPHADNQTGKLGVEVKRDKFSARICINGIRYSLGSFATADLAHEAYIAAKRKLHPRGSI